MPESTQHKIGRLFHERRAPTPLVDITDRELHDTLVSHGFPANESFIQFSYTLPHQYKMLRAQAVAFYADVQAARRGDKLAKEAVDYCQETWLAMRRNAEEKAREQNG